MANQNVKVLLVDDSRTVRMAATKMFNDKFELVLAVDGADGLSIIESDSNIQAVLTDLVMPKMDGFELLKAIRSHKDERIRQLPVIVSTGAENPEIAREKAMKLGATDFITKPFVATEVCTRVRSYAKFTVQTTTLKAQATIDTTTGLLNKKGFNQQAHKGLSLAARHEQPLITLCFEIDNHKNLFIEMGRKASGAVINRVGKSLSSNIRKEDTIARTGMARFGVLMPMGDERSALEIANKICREIENLKIKLNGKLLKLTISVGAFHCYPDDKLTLDTILDGAEKAYEQATAIGRSQISLLTMSEYCKKYKTSEAPLSIDLLLDQIARGNEMNVAPRLDEAIEQLAPLFCLLSQQQKQRIFSFR